MNILVTGGAGFIGSHLCKKLVTRDTTINGDYVICIDSLVTGTKSNIKELLPYYNFEFIRHDIIDPIKLEVDQIYNLACPASPIQYQKNAIKTIKTNVIGTMNMLGLANRVKARFLQASTSEVYGDPLEHPQTEKYFGNVNPISPRSNYDEGKRVAETLCMDYHRMNNVDIRIARIFNIYGPKMSPDDGRVVSNFIRQAQNNEDITIYGNGRQTRSFCYVDDMITGLINLMDSDYIYPVNLGNPDEFSILELANKIIKLTHSKSQMVFEKLPKDDPARRKPDISLAKKIIGFDPKISLDEGLKRTINGV